MEITEVRVFLKEGPDKKLKAYATLTFDNCFVVRNVKVIQGNKGLFVAMPSRKVREGCPKCNYKNAIRSRFCNQCGAGLPQPQMQNQQNPSVQRQAEHKDIAHPITLDCREMIQKKVLSAYEAEAKESASKPQGKRVKSEEEHFQDEHFPIEENEDEIEGKDITL